MTTAALVEGIAARPRRRLEVQLANGVSRIFRRQARAFPAQRVAEAAIEMSPQRIDEVAVPRDDDAFLQLVYSLWPDEEQPITNVISLFGGRAALSASNYTLARLGYPRSATLLDVVADRLAANALERATGIEQVSMERIRNKLVQGLRDGKEARVIARDLRSEFEGWTRTSARGKLKPGDRAIVRRADMIARTEIAEATESASYDVMAAHGVSGRRWVTADDERVDNDGISGPCIDNEEAGVVPIADPFPSGAMWPPQHPLCRCTTIPVYEQ